ncbi:hypothetical protein [Evansella cellulosilytica]|nr:hypothetical protein [Evansella cellulosilytica]
MKIYVETNKVCHTKAMTHEKVVGTNKVYHRSAMTREKVCRYE